MNEDRPAPSEHRSLKIADYISYAYLTFQRVLSLFFSTAVLRLTAAIFGITIGKGTKCWGSVQLLRWPGSEITIGKNVTIVSSSPRATASSIYAPTRFKTHSRSARIIIEDRVGLNGTSLCARSKSITIGEGTMIAPNVTIMDSDFHALWPPEKRLTAPSMEEDRDVLIGRNVWIGTQCIILKGAVIGENSVIAAGSVVRGEIPRGVLAGGVPAKVIRTLP
ncbi:MAG: acyltransferase [Candidatus Eremiobacteraeota bacterium]|nr:acyltransferase [Candidatus Eremiobacteraeota bacterium]